MAKELFKFIHHGTDDKRIIVCLDDNTYCIDKFKDKGNRSTWKVGEDGNIWFKHNYGEWVHAKDDIDNKDHYYFRKGLIEGYLGYLAEQAILGGERDGNID